MNLSRAAKKFRSEMPPEPKSPKLVDVKPKTSPPPPPPAPEPVTEVVAVVPVAELPPPAVEPAPEPVAVVEHPEPAPPPAPKKVWRVKEKRARFVREKTEPRVRPDARPLPPRSTKPVARFLTQNLALPPKEDAPKLPR